MTEIAANSMQANDHVPTSQVAASLAACERIVRSRARNFWFGLRMTPRPRRDALYALYAWMRLGDDLVDEPASPDAARARFQEFVNTSRCVIADGCSTDASKGHLIREQTPDCWPAFAWLLRTFPLQRPWLEAMLAGLESDLTHTPLQTRHELDLYRHRVAGTVGMCCSAIWGLRPGVDPAHAFKLADTRGRAFQMVNILRDIGRDARESPRRVYVPADALSRHALRIDDLLAWRNPRACEDFIAEFTTVARDEFRESAELSDLIAPDCVRVLGAMTEIYEGVLHRLETNPRRCIADHAASLPTWRKAWIAAKWNLRGAHA
jgi:phytoene synthase